jgi:hypothetical protein
VTELKKIGEPVRNFYRRQGWEEGYKAGNGILVKAVESAKALERERIIRLLEVVSDGAEVSASLASLTALIRGENK